MLRRPYPIRRILPLVEAISQDFNDQLLRVLGSQRLMYMDYAKFDDVMSLAGEVFVTWDENMKDFTNVAREGEPLLSRLAALMMTPQCPGSASKSSSRSKSPLPTPSCRKEWRTSAGSVGRTSRCAS